MFYPKLIKDLMAKVFIGAGGIHVYQNQTFRKKRVVILDHIMHLCIVSHLFVFVFRESFGSVLDSA